VDNGQTPVDEDAIEHLTSVNAVVRRHMASQRFRRVWLSGARGAKREGPGGVGRNAEMYRFERTTGQACLVETALRRAQAEFKLKAGDYSGADKCMGMARSAFQRVQHADLVDLDDSTVWGRNVKSALKALEASEHRVRAALARQAASSAHSLKALEGQDRDARGTGPTDKRPQSGGAAATGIQMGEDLQKEQKREAIRRRIAAVQAGKVQQAEAAAGYRHEAAGACDAAHNASSLADKAGPACRLGQLSTCASVSPDAAFLSTCAKRPARCGRAFAAPFVL
jgi:hypothetical protein